MEIWDYKIPQQPMWDMQKDWNQSIVTKFNMLCAGIDTEIIVKVPNKFKSLIESLYFYDNINSTINNRYIIKFIDSEEDLIIVGNNKLKIINY